MARVDNTGGSGFTVDNGTGLVVRTKVNQIIAALSTTNQGSGDPSIGVAAYTQHIDGNTLKIRNAANNAFVSCTARARVIISYINLQYCINVNTICTVKILQTIN